MHTKARQIVNREAEKQATSHLGTTNDLTVLRGGERRNEEEENKNREFPSCDSNCASLLRKSRVSLLFLSHSAACQNSHLALPNAAVDKRGRG